MSKPKNNTPSHAKASIERRKSAATLIPQSRKADLEEVRADMRDYRERIRAMFEEGKAGSTEWEALISAAKNAVSINRVIVSATGVENHIK